MILENAFSKTKALIGDEAFALLRNSTVAVVGLGGVGAAACEALYRVGIGHLVVMDFDTISESNLNRQIFTTEKSIGEKKCLNLAKRLYEIHRLNKITTLDLFYSKEVSEYLFAFKPDFIIDAIDTVSSKLDLINAAISKNVDIISCMGSGNRLDPTAFKIGNITDTAGCGCGLARVMRRELKRLGIDKLPVVYSTETPITTVTDDSNGRHAPASISFCPPVAGNILASYAIKKIISTKKT